MKKKTADILNVCFLVLGIVILPFLKDCSILQGRTMGFISVMILLMLIVRLVSYFTGYSEEEKKTDKLSVLILVILWLITSLLAFLGI